MSNEQRTKLFLDMEFTDLTQDAKPLSLALISEHGDEFYIELRYNPDDCSQWVKENVLPKMLGTNLLSPRQAQHEINEFLKKFELVEVWGDCLQYDWVIFREIFLGQLPEKISYLPFDICTWFRIYGIDPDISREEFSRINNVMPLDVAMKSKHDALYDAHIIKLCFERLSRIDAQNVRRNVSPFSLLP